MRILCTYTHGRPLTRHTCLIEPDDPWEERRGRVAPCYSWVSGDGLGVRYVDVGFIWVSGCVGYACMCE